MPGRAEERGSKHGGGRVDAIAQGHELLGEAVIHLVCEPFTCFEGCTLPQRGKGRCHVNVGTVGLAEMDQSVKFNFKEWAAEIQPVTPTPTRAPSWSCR